MFRFNIYYYWFFEIYIWISGSALQATKGIRWMPWRWKAMKDVVSCDKPRGGANNL